jgi:hypothetical protein
MDRKLAIALPLVAALCACHAHPTISPQRELVCHRDSLESFRKPGRWRMTSHGDFYTGDGYETYKPSALESCQIVELPEPSNP